MLSETDCNHGSHEDVRWNVPLQLSPTVIHDKLSQMADKTVITQELNEDSETPWSNDNKFCKVCFPPAHLTGPQRLGDTALYRFCRESTEHVEMTAKLPDLDQLKMKDFEFVYEPSDDTFLLCDALETDRAEITLSKPKIVVEIGWDYRLFHCNLSIYSMVIATYLASFV